MGHNQGDEIQGQERHRCPWGSRQIAANRKAEYICVKRSHSLWISLGHQPANIGMELSGTLLSALRQNVGFPSS
jgi:hypothetical protein